MKLWDTPQFNKTTTLSFQILSRTFQDFLVVRSAIVNIDSCRLALVPHLHLFFHLAIVNFITSETMCNCLFLQTWLGLNFSSHLKHNPFLMLSCISSSNNFLKVARRLYSSLTTIHVTSYLRCFPFSSAIINDCCISSLTTIHVTCETPFLF